jgi:hypothetical protein
MNYPSTRQTQAALYAALRPRLPRLSWYAVSGADRMIDPALQCAMAQRIGATTVEFDDAIHAGGFTHYSTRLVKLIEQATS